MLLLDSCPTSVRQQRGRPCEPARGNRGHGLAQEDPAHINCHRRGALGGRAVTQLSVEVGAPGKDFPVGGQCHRVVKARGNRGLAQEDTLMLTATGVVR